MNLEEYGKVKEMSYSEYCGYLRGKYGCPKHNYPNKADIRSSEGLFIHHIGENEVANLSNESVRKESDPKYQSPEMLGIAQKALDALDGEEGGEKGKGEENT